MKERGPLKAEFRGNLFQLKCKFVLRNSDAAAFEDGGLSLKKQPKVRQLATPDLRMIVEKMVWLSGEGIPIPDALPSINRVAEIRTLLRRLAEEEPLRPLRDRVGGPRASEEIEHDEELSSQAFATQAPAISYDSSDDDDDSRLSVISQHFGEDSALQTTTGASRQPRSESPQHLNAPPSSPPVQTRPLHPGWEGMTEITAQMTEIPEDQRKELEKPGCTYCRYDVASEEHC